MFPVPGRSLSGVLEPARGTTQSHVPSRGHRTCASTWAGTPARAMRVPDCLAWPGSRELSWQSFVFCFFFNFCLTLESFYFFPFRWKRKYWWSFNRSRAEQWESQCGKLSLGPQEVIWGGGRARCRGVIPEALQWPREGAEERLWGQAGAAESGLPRTGCLLGVSGQGRVKEPAVVLTLVERKELQRGWVSGNIGCWGPGSLENNVLG